MTVAIAKAIWLVCVIAWWIIRYPYERRAKQATVARSGRDAGEWILLAISLTGLGIVPIIYVFTGYPRIADHAFVPALAWAGIVPALASLWLFHRTHRELGRNWSVSLEVRDQHRLVTSGVYRYVRHPMYSAFFLWAVAQGLLLPNWVAGLSGLIGFGILFWFRVGREERLMLETFGQDYRTYMAHTARIVPWIY
jgi:protein-S-isoprenylcysteine O-methyltransferase Ste14